MWLVVGLGNPGDRYANTRHNIGFIVIDALSAEFSISLKYKTKHFIYGRGFIGGENIILLKPLTFMNKSGIALRAAIRRYKGIDKILVVHDDLDIEKGVIRIRKTGSSGGHKGIESIIEILGIKDFVRLKIGVGRSNRLPPEKYLLCDFNKREKKVIEEAIEKAVNAIHLIINKGILHAQNKFN